MTMLVQGVLSASSSSAALTDFDGAGNTPKIIEQLRDYTDVDGTVGAPAAEACANYTFPNGKKGYLPALGEWKTAYNNKAALVSAMSLIGGKTIQTAAHWSSTQSGGYSAWELHWGTAYAGDMYKRSSYVVRAFQTL